MDPPAESALKPAMKSVPPAWAGGSDTQRAGWSMVPPADAGGTDLI